MIHFKILTLRNFLSYGNNVTVINLDNPGTTLIKGEDLDNTSSGAGANGVGKSTMINALAYAVYDKPVSDISKEKLVNNINQKDMEVTVEFSDSHDNEYRIVRNRKVKGSAGGGVYFYKNGEDITLDSIANTNTLIQSVIGIPHEMFVRIVVFSASHTPFLDLPARAQADMIEGLFGVTEISDRAATLKEHIKDTEARLNIKKAVIEQANKERQRHEVQIANAKQRIETWATTNQTSIKKLRATLAHVASIDVDEQQRYHSELASINADITTTKNEIKDITRSTSTAMTKYTKLSGEIAHLKDAKCPYCLQQFVDAASKIDGLVSEVESIEAELLEQDVHKQALASKLSQLIEKADAVAEKITVDNITELVKIAKDSSTLAAQLADMESATNPHDSTLQELLDMKFDDIKLDEVDTLTRELEHQKFLLKLLTKNDSFVRKTLLNRYLPYLNAQLQHYLDTLGLPHRVEFMHNLSAKISQFGRELDFGNLSAGQRARVNFALSFAFRDVLQRLHTKINVCMLDEVLDVGLDTVGVQAAAKLVKHKAREEELSMFIVSHRDEIDGIFDKVMTVQMSQGFSYIKDEEVA